MDGIWILAGLAGLLVVLALSCDLGSSLARRAEIRRGRLPRVRPEPERSARRRHAGRPFRDPPVAPRGPRRRQAAATAAR